MKVKFISFQVLYVAGSTLIYALADTGTLYVKVNSKPWEIVSTDGLPDFNYRGL